MNLMTKEKQTLRHRKHTYGHQRGKGVVLVLAAQSCPTLCYRMGCSLLGASVHGILQSIILVWVAIPFSRGSLTLQADSVPSEPLGKPKGVERGE